MEINLIEKKSSNLNAKNIIIIGVFHGEEPQGKFIVDKFLNENDFKNINNNLFFIPCLNPFGFKKGTRGNENGVDLNRNYPTKNWVITEKNQYYSGTNPASEPETKFMIDLLEKINPDVILTLHAPFKIVNYDGPAKELAEKISELTGYRVQEDIGYPTPGSFGTYCGAERNIPTITLELDEEDTNENLYKKVKLVFEYLASLEIT